jgi:hypothetical protein
VSFAVIIRGLSSYILSSSQHKLVTGRRQHMVVPAVLFFSGYIRSTTKWALASFLFLTAVEVKSTPAFTRLCRLYVARCRGDWHLGTPKLHWPTAGSVRVPRAICRPIYIRLGPIQRSSARALIVFFRTTMHADRHLQLTSKCMYSYLDKVRIPKS